MPDDNENPTPAPAPVTELPTDDGLSDEDLSFFMNYDPFDEAAAPEEEPGEAEPESGSAPAPASPAPAPQPEPTTSDRLAAALEQIAKLPQAGAQPTPTQAPKPDPAAVEAELNTRLGTLYAYNIPDTTVAGLQSEDPGVVRQTLAGVIQHLSVSIHRNLLREVGQVMAEFQGKTLPTTLARHRQEVDAQQMIAMDMYGTYPALNTPLLRKFTMERAMELFQRTGQRAWTPEFRDMVAQSVAQDLYLDPASLGPAPQAPAPKAVAPAKRPNKMLSGPGARPAQPRNSSDENGPEAIRDFILGPRRN